MVCTKQEYTNSDTLPKTCQNSCKLIIEADKFRANFLGQQILSNKMTIIFYVYNSHMKYRTESNENNCLVITIHIHLINFTKLQLLKELFYPHKFTSEGCYRPILNFDTRLNNHILFLAFMGNNFALSESTIPISGTNVFRRSCPINITIPDHMSICFIFK